MNFLSKRAKRQQVYSVQNKALLLTLSFISFSSIYFFIQRTLSRRKSFQIKSSDILLITTRIGYIIQLLRYVQCDTSGISKPYYLIK